MVYGSINKVRTLAGIKPVFSHGQKLKSGTGSKTEFRVPTIGENTGFFVDLAADKTSTITVDDVVVYVDGTPVTVSSLDQDAGTVTLAVAPIQDAVVTIDYQYSEVSDDDVIDSMNQAEEMIDIIIRGKNVADNSYTQTNSGDGYKSDFEFDHSDVITVDTVTVDGIVLVSGTDYYLWKFQRTSRYWYIEFVNPPNYDFQNVVIAYTHGEVTNLADKLSNLYAARYLLQGDIRLSESKSRWVDGDGKKEAKGDRSRMAMVNREIMAIQDIVNKREIYG